MCQRRAQRDRVPSPSPPSTLAPSLQSTFRPSDATVNLLHMKLFHHFQSNTIQTLLFPAEVWNHAIQLAFHSDFLMSAILCIAARHLSFLDPEDVSYPVAAYSHVCRALAGSHLQLGTDLASVSLDAFIATSLLLQFVVWINTDFLSAGRNALSFDPSEDHLFSFCASLRHFFIRSFPSPALQTSVFMPCIRNGPIDPLVNVARISNAALTEFQNFYSYQKSLTVESLSTPYSYTEKVENGVPEAWKVHLAGSVEARDPIQDGYIPVVTRLCLILSFLGDGPSGSQDGATLPALARYILFFPITCRGPFASMVDASDPHALLLLYHFYRAVKVLLSSAESWWAHARASASTVILENHLQSIIGS